MEPRFANDIFPQWSTAQSYKRRCFKMWIFVHSAKQLKAGVIWCVAIGLFIMDGYSHVYQAPALTLQTRNSCCLLCAFLRVHVLQEAIQLDGEILFALLRRVSPLAFRHLEKHKIDPILYMTEWFMCAFSRTLPWASVLRVWDMFLCDGNSSF